MSDNRLGQAIRPASFDSPDSGVSNTRDEQSTRRKLTPAWLVIPLLLVVALLMIFYLPGQIGTDSVSPANRAPEEISLVPQETPFADTQLLEARRNAQEILAEFIAAQRQLQRIQVDRWSPDAYATLLDNARAGDAAYQERRFNEAITLYRQALQGATSLLASRPEAATQQLALAWAAFESSRKEEAIALFELALTLDPDSTDARTGLARSEVMDEVEALQAEARTSIQQGEYARAETLLGQASELDARNPEVESLLALVRTELREQEFRQLIAGGFSAMADGRYESAEMQFRRANALFPGREVVADALTQVASLAQTATQTGMHSQAREAEAQEDWRRAVELYEKLLAEDASLLEARTGLLRSRTRLELDQSIDEVLQNPLALQSDQAWNQAEQLLADARTIRDKSPQFEVRINKLAEVIQRARTPVEVTLISDGQTDIEIYRVGQLGRLQNRVLSLYPGNYVVVGKRSGFRDVRRDLQVTGEQPQLRLEVAATESIR